ncbi:MAG: glycyl-radical enzyme activating protein [Asgard group archaeon]|nr:glycyl-radical enzyme activating protein [Asgard group archaeon]
MTKGIIFDIKKFAVHDGPGIRTTIFFKGCSMNWWWCHNPEGQSFFIETINQNKTNDRCETEIIGREISVDEVLEEIMKDFVFYEESNGGVTISGGEPLHQLEFLRELLLKCKKKKLHTTLDTAGYVSQEMLENVMNLIDLFLYDIKLIDNKKHKKYTGISNKIILSNLEFLSDKNKQIIVRIPIIPSINDTKSDLDDFGGYLNKLNLLSVELIPFHKIGETKYKKLNKVNRMKDIKEPTKEDMLRVKEHLKTFQLNVKIEE